MKFLNDLSLKVICIIFIISLTALSDLIAGSDSVPMLEKKHLTSNKQEQVGILIRLSKQYENLNLKRAVESSNRAIGLAKEINYIKGKAEAYLVYANQIIRFEVDDSVVVLKEKAYDLYMSIGEEHLAAKALLDIARTTLMLHQYTKTNERRPQYIEKLISPEIFSVGWIFITWSRGKL